MHRTPCSASFLLTFLCPSDTVLSTENLALSTEITMLAIRFARVGKTKQPTYRITVSDKRRDMFGRALEILGHYNPRAKVCEVNAERIKHWLSVGAQPSSTVHNLLVDQNLIAGPKVRVSRPKKKHAEGAGIPATGTAPAGGAAGKPEPAAEQHASTPAAEAAPNPAPLTPPPSP